MSFGPSDWCLKGVIYIVVVVVVVAVVVEAASVLVIQITVAFGNRASKLMVVVYKHAGNSVVDSLGSIPLSVNGSGIYCSVYGFAFCSAICYVVCSVVRSFCRS